MAIDLAIDAVHALIESERNSPTVLTSLKQLRDILAPLGVTVHRSRHGYYYFASDVLGLAPSSGVYTFSVEHTTLTLWLIDLLTYLEENR